MYDKYPNEWDLPVEGPVNDWFACNFPDGFQVVCYHAVWDGMHTLPTFWTKDARPLDYVLPLGNEGHVVKIKYWNMVWPSIFPESFKYAILELPNSTMIITNDRERVVRWAQELVKDMSNFLDYADTEMQNIEVGIV